MKKLILGSALIGLAACSGDPDAFDNPRPDGKVYKLSIMTEGGMEEFMEETESNCTMLRALHLSANPGSALIVNCMPVHRIDPAL